MSKITAQIGIERKKVLVDYATIVGHFNKETDALLKLANKYDMCLTSLTLYKLYKDLGSRPDMLEHVFNIQKSMEVIPIDADIVYNSYRSGVEKKLTVTEAFDIAVAKEKRMRYISAKREGLTFE